MNRIEEDFKQYKKGYAECRNCDVRLYAPSDLLDWTTALLDRSRVTSSVFENNTRIIKEHFLPVIQGKVILSEEEMDSLFLCTFDLYVKNLEDPFILKMLLSILLPYYTQHEDVRKLVKILVMFGFAEIEISRTGDSAAGERSVQYYRQAASCWTQAMESMDPEVATYVYIAYVNLCFVEVSLNNITKQESEAYVQEFRQLHQMPAFASMEQNNGRMRELAQRLEQGEVNGQGLPFTEEFQERNEVSLENIERVHRTFAKQVESLGSVYALNPILVFNEYWIHAQEGTWSWNEAYQKAEHFFEVVDQTAHTRQDLDLLQFEMSVPLSLLHFLDQTTFTEEEKSKKAERILERFVDFVRAYPAGVNSYTMIEGLQIFTFNPLVMRFLKDTDKRRRFVFTLLVTRQPITYIHCSMVARLLSILLSYVLDAHPEWLIGTLGIQDAQTIGQRRNEILEYANYAALFHDIGKNNMIEIVGTEYRAITDEEFVILKTHPIKGAEYLDQVEDFKGYADVAMGHHQFYDNTGGYPSVQVFDHQKSPVRFLIEAVMLCDCLDAATDDLGRNYHKAKSFEAVLHEFEKGAGHQYNPELVNLILKNPQLQKELGDLVHLDRGKVCYDVYKQFFHQAE